MKRLLLFVLLAAFVSASTAPILSKVMGFGPATAYAQNDDDQGEDNDDQ
jgi:hypothetical protein